MKENDTILIRAVDNGFIVEPELRQMKATSNSEIKVFRSKNELHRFTEDHFTHRGHNLESDAT